MLRSLQLMVFLVMLSGCFSATMHSHANRGNLAGVQEAIAEGQDINSRDASGDTPLHHAAWKGNQQIVEFLIQNGADVRAKSQAGQTPLHVAAAFGYTEIVSKLIQSGADVNAQMNDGRTPLFRAAADGQAEVLEILLRHDADPNIANVSGATALSYVETPAVQNRIGVNRASTVVAILNGVGATRGEPGIDVAAAPASQTGRQAAALAAQPAAAAPSSASSDAPVCGESEIRNLTAEQGKALLFVVERNLGTRRVACITNLVADDVFPFRGQTMIRYTATVSFPNGYKTVCFPENLNQIPEIRRLQVASVNRCGLGSYLDPLGEPARPGDVRRYSGETLI